MGVQIETITNGDGKILYQYSGLWLLRVGLVECLIIIECPTLATTPPPPRRPATLHTVSVLVYCSVTVVSVTVTVSRNFTRF